MTIPAHIIVDYQNVHLTAHDVWCPSAESRHLCLIHPLLYANQVLAQRNLLQRLVSEKSDLDFKEASLASVRTFRGQPSNRYDPTAYRRSQAQRSEWTRDDRSQVTLRPLKYSNGGRTVQEKGVDVLVALELVTYAALVAKLGHGVVILAAHDTDQEPALEMACALAPGQVETTGWMNSKRLRAGAHRTWHTQLDNDAFQRAQDPRDYT